MTSSLVAMMTFFLGEWTPVLSVLIWLAAVDCVIGVYVACGEKKRSSGSLLPRLKRKILILVLVAAAHKLDVALDSAGFLRNVTLYFYIAHEGLSLLENISRTGVPIPSPLKTAFQQLKKHSEGTGKATEHKDMGNE